MKKQRSSKRIHAMDELRGFCIVLMVFFHAFYLIGDIFEVEFFYSLYKFFLPVEPIFAGIFIFLCGVSCNLSHNNLKRGSLLALVAAFLSLVMWCAIFWRIIPEYDMIWFGILHMLAVCILLYTLLRPTLQLIPPWLGFLLCAVLFALTWHFPETEGGYFGFPGLFALPLPIADTTVWYLYPFGLCPVGLCSDYFPLFPWLFCFLGGSFLGVYAKRGKLPKGLYRSRFSALSFIGRHSLLIYLFHQPILFGIATVISWIIESI